MRFIRQNLGVFVLALLIAVPASASTFRVKCDQGQKVNRTLERAKPGDKIIVLGTCQEAVVFLLVVRGRKM